MNELGVEAFTLYFMKPIYLAAVLYLAIFTLLIVSLMKAIRNGAQELQQRDGNFQDIDLMLAMCRILFVLMFVSIFFGF